MPRFQTKNEFLQIKIFDISMPVYVRYFSYMVYLVSPESKDTIKAETSKAKA